MPVPDYLKPLIIAYEGNANIENAIPMKKYMRNKFEFYGIKSPERKSIYAQFKKSNGLIPQSEKKEIIRWCWEADQREYQMFAMEFLGRSSKKESEDIINLYEYMIVTKSWWDTVDYIASNLVGIYFQKFPDKILPVTSKWMESENIWLQRTCLLFQLKYKNNLNTTLLDSFISKTKDSNEFFIQKAIGWILREYSKTNPYFVKDYIKENQIANLSRREGMLYIKKRQLVSP